MSSIVAILGVCSIGAFILEVCSNSACDKAVVSQYLNLLRHTLVVSQYVASIYAIRHEYHMMDCDTIYKKVREKMQIKTTDIIGEVT